MDLPVVLDEEARLPVVHVHRRTHVEDIAYARRWQARQEPGETGEAVRVDDRAARVVAVFNKVVDGLVADKVGTGLDGVLAGDDRSGVAEGHQALVERA